MNISIVARFGCEVCGQPFSKVKNGYQCRKHKTKPQRYYLDFTHNKKRIRIFCDKQGQPIDSYSRALSLTDIVKAEIQNHSFSLNQYKESDIKKYSFEKQIDAFYKEKEIACSLGNNAPSYLDSIKSYINNYYKPFFKLSDVRDITSSDIKDFYLQMPKRKEKTISNILKFLQHFFRTLERFDIINKCPAFPLIRIQEPTPKWTSTENQLKLLQAIPLEHRGIFTMILFQGVRPSEARSVRHSDISIENGIVTIRRTFSNGRLIERNKGRIEKPRLIHPMVMEVLKAMPKGFPDAFVFLHPRTGKHYSKTRLEDIFRKARQETKIDINLYSAGRHSVGTNAMINNPNLQIQVLRDYLGHSESKTTEKYIHLSVLQQSQIFEKQPTKIIPIASRK